MDFELLHRKINGVRLSKLKRFRNRKLSNKEFTLIANNCWAGMVYQAYDLQKQSPTIGSFFYPDDYLRFLVNFDSSTTGDISIICPEESRNWETLRKRSDVGSFPIGLLPSGAEICFLHYHNEHEAIEKWQRRCQRINKDKLIIKFCDQNGCKIEHVEAFARLPFSHKLFFTCKDWPINRDEYIKIKQFPKKDYIAFSWEPFSDSHYLNLTNLINSL